MLKGLAITPPVVGRISIGQVVENDGKRTPQPIDEFVLTTQIQQRGQWLRHPIDAELRKDIGGDPTAKLRRIPVRVLFTDPQLNFRAQYSMFDSQTGRPICVGDGATCRRTSDSEVISLPCPSPSSCEIGHVGGCRPYGRLNVVVGDDDEMRTFIFRTTSYNSIRTLSARLLYFQAISGNRLPWLPLELRLRGKSSQQSHSSAIYYVDLVTRKGESLKDALSQAQEMESQRKLMGFHQTALDEAARAGFSNGAFEDSPEERLAVVEEFYPAGSNATPSSATSADAKRTSPSSIPLRDKLIRSPRRKVG